MSEPAETAVAGAPAVERELERAERSGARTIVLDLRGLRFIDTSGLRVVVLAHRRQSGRLAVVRGPIAFAQEAMTNALRHADARNIALELAAGGIECRAACARRRARVHAGVGR